MNILLLGYMGSGKSTIGRLLASKLGFTFIDFDAYIEKEEQRTILKIFEEMGEIYFRRKEMIYLTQLLDSISDKSVVALGGGTPCYGNSMELIKKSSVLSIYLNGSVGELTTRLWNEKDKRPLIAALGSREDLEDYIRKHLFERGFYYNQADKQVKIDDKSPKDIIEEIVGGLF